MKSFAYLFGVFLGLRLLKHTDNLSKTLQDPSLSSSKAQSIADLTVRTLSSIRNDESFQLFWKTLLFQQKVNVHEPELPRRRKVPARYEISSGEGVHPSTPEGLYRQHYFECLDHVVNCIKDRFDQPGYGVLRKLETLLLNAARGERSDDGELQFVVNHAKDDL